MRNFCHLCGALYVKGKANPWQCSGCGNVSYENPCPTADLLLFNDRGEVLLSKRAIDPAKGKYDFPGGFLHVGETFEEAVRREIWEELGLGQADYSDPVYVTSQASTYPFSKEVKPVVGVTFAAKLLSTAPVNGHDDVASVRFVSMKELDQIQFSLDFLPSIILKAHKLLGYN